MIEVKHECDNGCSGEDQVYTCLCRSCLDEIKEDAYQEGENNGYDTGYTDGEINSNEPK